MSNDFKYELAVAECNSLRQQLKDAYNKCSAIYEALSILDEYSTNERTILENLISDLKQTIKNQLEKNMILYNSKLYIEQNEKYLKNKLHNTTKNYNNIMFKYQKIYIKQQQEKYIQDNIIIQMKKIK